MKCADIYFPKSWGWYEIMHIWADQNRHWFNHSLRMRIEGGHNIDNWFYVMPIHLDVAEE